ncbi:MAG: hypothetical protein A2452_05160 [Candidatus Firestonebacteria bacterium RIFOXYC2_FULL_39_67]|nr:MAG: hypothetical protein A2536_10725 [Candidatus Firestonebacteria bacterium RIFOXYD2_FULL_39_29]OGF53030.1 MAG: hypothetical protein A2497_02530 [Candidatus Firestonebacteria bacterium RifOxyC12_full_39_7]OGF54514.1 MAG: hypothetical protein A2452_05160 [Candidatus Firestonebacteria bacterium RIFOXYC2_FULL_39_67]
MNKMKAAVIHGPFDLRIEKINIPKIDNDSLLIKVKGSSICSSTDYHIYDGSYLKYNQSIKTPHVFGHEFSGQVVKTGKNIKKYKIGDRIALGCKIGGMDGAGFSEYCRIYPSRMFSMDVLKKNLNYEEGALLEPLYGVLASAYSSEIRPADKVLILGAGTIGLLHLQVVKNMLAGEIIVADVYENRLKKAKELGADLVINTKEKDLTGTVRKYCNEVDLIIDAAGTDDPGLFNITIELLKANGRYMVYGHATKPSQVNMIRIASKGVKVVGVAYAHDRMIQLGNKLVSEGRINLKTLITHRIKLDDLEKGIKKCNQEKDKVIKMMVKF